MLINKNFTFIHHLNLYPTSYRPLLFTQYKYRHDYPGLIAFAHQLASKISTIKSKSVNKLQIKIQSFSTICLKRAWFQLPRILNQFSWQKFPFHLSMNIPVPVHLVNMYSSHLILAQIDMPVWLNLVKVEYNA